MRAVLGSAAGCVLFNLGGPLALVYFTKPCSDFRRAVDPRTHTIVLSSAVQHLMQMMHLQWADTKRNSAPTKVFQLTPKCQVRKELLLSLPLVDVVSGVRFQMAQPHSADRHLRQLVLRTPLQTKWCNPLVLHGFGKTEP